MSLPVTFSYQTVSKNYYLPDNVLTHLILVTMLCLFWPCFKGKYTEALKVKLLAATTPDLFPSHFSAHCRTMPFATLPPTSNCVALLRTCCTRRTERYQKQRDAIPSLQHSRLQVLMNLRDGHHLTICKTIKISTNFNIAITQGKFNPTEWGRKYFFYNLVKKRRYPSFHVGI
jgi:hypothetical protein